jgi:hypothetical protein
VTNLPPMPVQYANYDKRLMSRRKHRWKPAYRISRFLTERENLFA